jgi:ribonuclease HII
VGPIGGSVSGKTSGSSRLPHLEYELAAGFPRTIVIGVDEVGRGCLAGPVVAGAAVLPPDALTEHKPAWVSQVRDSKLVAPRVRASLESGLQSWLGAWSLGEASVIEIDQINILNAVELAMKRAVDGVLARLGLEPYAENLFVLVDGNRIPRTLGPVFGGRIRAVVKGDQQSLTIACASILAKVARDRDMERLEATSPGYGLGVHKGYGTPGHLEAIAKLGVAEFHRKSFAPVRDLLHLRS